jgi:hypothetical protein
LKNQGLDQIRFKKEQDLHHDINLRVVSKLAKFCNAILTNQPESDSEAQQKEKEDAMKSWLPATNNWGREAHSREPERIHDEEIEQRAAKSNQFGTPERE